MLRDACAVRARMRVCVFACTTGSTSLSAWITVSSHSSPLLSLHSFSFSVSRFCCLLSSSRLFFLRISIRFPPPLRTLRRPDPQTPNSSPSEEGPTRTYERCAVAVRGGDEVAGRMAFESIAVTQAGDGRFIWTLMPSEECE